MNEFWERWLLQMNRAIAENKEADIKIQGLMAIARIGAALDDIAKHCRH